MKKDCESLVFVVVCFVASIDDKTSLSPSMHCLRFISTLSDKKRSFLFDGTRAGW